MSELPIIIRTANDPLRFKFPEFVTTDKGQKILIQSVDIHCEVQKPMRVTITGTPLETVDDQIREGDFVGFDSDGTIRRMQR